MLWEWIILTTAHLTSVAIRVVVAKKKVDLNVVRAITVTFLDANRQESVVHTIVQYTNVAKVAVLIKEVTDYIAALTPVKQVDVQVKLMDIAVTTNAENVILKD